MSRVTVEGLVKRYGNVAAVAGVDLAIEQGEFVVLLGPSGCGKTTTLRCIAGLEEVSDGRIAMGGQIVSTASTSLPPEQRNIGMVFQSYAIWPHMSVFENVAFGLKLKKLPRAQIEQRVARTLELVGLAGLAHRGASQLSGGQLQRVALARAIIPEPGVLLFDEPLSNLDAKLRERMRFELRQLQKRLGITSIYVTHDQQEAMVVADRIVLMRDGRIEQIGGPEEMYHRPRSLFAAEFIGLTNLVRGRVALSGPRTTVALPGGLQLISADAGFSAGQPLDVLCRPEQLRIGAERGPDENSFEAIVTGTTFLGNIADLMLRAGEIELRSQLSPPHLWPNGTRLWVHIPAEAVVLLPTAEPTAQERRA